MGKNPYGIHLTDTSVAVYNVEAELVISDQFDIQFPLYVSNAENEQVVNAIRTGSPARSRAMRSTIKAITDRRREKKPSDKAYQISNFPPDEVRGRAGQA